MADRAHTGFRRRILRFAEVGVLGAIAVVIAVVVVSNDGRSDRAGIPDPARPTTTTTRAPATSTTIARAVDARCPIYDNATGLVANVAFDDDHVRIGETASYTLTLTNPTDAFISTPVKLYVVYADGGEQVTNVTAPPGPCRSLSLAPRSTATTRGTLTIPKTLPTTLRPTPTGQAVASLAYTPYRARTKVLPNGGIITIDGARSP